MPTYEYACRGCGQHLEVVQSFKDDALTECPSCQGELRKVFSAAGIIFKGSGWHVKDYASSSKGAPSGPGGSDEGGSKDVASEGGSDGDGSGKGGSEKDGSTKVASAKDGSTKGGGTAAGGSSGSERSTGSSGASSSGAGSTSRASGGSSAAKSA